MNSGGLYLPTPVDPEGPERAGNGLRTRAENFRSLFATSSYTAFCNSSRADPCRFWKKIMDSFLSVIGAVFLSYHGLSLAYQALCGIRSFVLPALGIKKDLRKYHPWAGECCNSCKIEQIIFWFRGNYSIYL